MRSGLRIALLSIIILGMPALGWAQAAQPAAEHSATPPVTVTLAQAVSDASPDTWQSRVRALFDDDFFEVAQRVVLGLLLFIAGWIIAKLIAWTVYRLLCKTSLDDRLAKKLGIDMLVGGGSSKSSQPHQIERFAGKVVYYLLMMLVIVGVLQYAGLSQAAGPIEGFVGKITTALPLVGKAILILVIAYFGGIILERLTSRVISGARLDERFAELSTPAPEVTTADATGAASNAGADAARPFSTGAGRVIFWLIMVAGVAGAVDALQIEPLADALRNAVDRMVSLLPSLAIAAALLVAGYVLARIVQAVVDNLLDAVGFNRVLARIELDKLTGKARPSAVIGSIAMGFIMLQAIIAALDELSLTTLSAPLTAMMAGFWRFLPIIAVSVLIVAAGVIGGRLLRGIVERSLQSVKFDAMMERIGFGALEEREGQLSLPHQVVGFIVWLGVILVATVQALQNLELYTWATYVNGFIEYSITQMHIAQIPQ